MAMNNRVLSIEIGNSFTKICEMDYKVKKPKVYKVLTVETPEGIVVDGMLQPTQEYADRMVNALGTNGIRTKKVIFTISSTRVASREVQIPNVKASKIEALVKTNANEYFPVDLTQYEIGHYLAGGLTENGKLRVMALAVPKALLDSYYQLAQMCSWEVECFDYSSNSLYQILRDEKSEKVTMVIKIDENSTIVTVLSAGKVLLQRTVAYGVQDAIDTMIASGAYAVNDPMSAVERFQKKTCLNRVLHPGDKVWEENAGRWEDEDAGNVEVTEARQKITASLEPLIVGVSRVIDFYDSRNSENPIEKSYVTGLGGSFSGMSKLFTNCLERKVHTLSEMDDKIGMSKAIRSTRPAAYISCLGAVLAPVGLIDKSTQKSKGLTVVSGTNYTFVSVAVLVLGVILSIAMAATSVTRYLGNVAQNVYLQNRVQELQPAQAVYNDYLAAEAQYDKYTYLYAYTQTPNENLVEFINELEQILPDSFYTNSFSSDQTGISMSVTVEGKAAAARTILNIRNMQSIDDVEISNITDSKDETGTSIVTFSITGSYKVLGVILSIAMAATSVTRYLGNVAQNVYLQNRVQELQPAQAVYNDYLAAEAQYDKYTYLYAYTQTPNENLVEFINELEQILPDSFYTNSFSSDQTGISMSVTVEGKAAAARTILNIRNMQSIDDVEISNITDSKDETGTSIVTFSITGSYKELTDETEESGEAQADTQTAQ